MPHHSLQLQLQHTTPRYMQQLWVRRPLQQLQKAQLQPPSGPSMDSRRHPCITTTHLFYSFLSLKLPRPPCAVSHDIPIFGHYLEVQFQWTKAIYLTIVLGALYPKYFRVKQIFRKSKRFVRTTPMIFSATSGWSKPPSGYIPWPILIKTPMGPSSMIPPCHEPTPMTGDDWNTAHKILSLGMVEMAKTVSHYRNVRPTTQRIRDSIHTWKTKEKQNHSNRCLFGESVFVYFVSKVKLSLFKLACNIKPPWIHSYPFNPIKSVLKSYSMSIKHPFCSSHSPTLAVVQRHPTGPFAPHPVIASQGRVLRDLEFAHPGHATYVARATSCAAKM